MKQRALENQKQERQSLLKLKKPVHKSISFKTTSLIHAFTKQFKTNTKVNITQPDVYVSMMAASYNASSL